MIATGLRAPDLVGGERVRDELGVDARVADAARDQLRVLAAQVEHEHRPLLGGGLRETGSGWTVAITAAGSSASPS